jgi:hypothetical protein
MPFEKSLDQPDVALPPVCQHLRTKAMYVHGTRETPSVHESSGHCWCNLTQHVRGPDSLLVDRKSCDSSRPCYQSLL